MRKKAYSILVDRELFKFSDAEILLHNKLYERYNKILNKLDGTCPEESPELFKIYLLRISNLQRIVNTLRGKSISAKLKHQISDIERQKTLTFKKYLLEKDGNTLIHIKVRIPKINIKIIGRINLIEDNISFSKYERFNEFIRNNQEINSQSMKFENENFMQHREEEKMKEGNRIDYDYKKKDRNEDHTTEDDIIRALSNGDGDLLGF
jgi:hypothetical protein